MSGSQDKVRLVYFYYTPFIFDSFARWLVLGIYRFRSQNLQEIDFWIFVAEQFLISVITIIFVQVRFRRLKRKYDFIKKKDYEEKVSVFSVLFRIAIVLSVEYIIYSVISEQQFYQDFIYLRTGADIFVPLMVFISYSTFVYILSLDSIRVAPEDKKKRSERTSIFPVGTWFQKTFTSEPEKPEILEEEELDASAFLDEYDFHIDRNDIHIAEIEGRLKNEATRVDAYMLESVMFGALAFSAFISIISSERFNWTLTERDDLRTETNIAAEEADLYVSPDSFNLLDYSLNIVNDPLRDSIVVATNQATTENTGAASPPLRELEGTEISNFWDDLMSFLNDVLLFKFPEANEKWDRLIDPANLIMVIMIETLFCAMFFLSVIASRLRYTRMTEEIDNLVRLSRAFNEKEEEVYNLVLQGLGDERVKQNLDRRLKVLALKIRNNITHARDLIARTRPILIYMSFFRNMGVLAFILVLISSSLFFSKTLASIFLLFTIIAYAYENLDSWVRIKRRRISN
ncbi:MAG: hypothetical protein ACFB0B_21675 [Thermonemataceae bacterium]